MGTQSGSLEQDIERMRTALEQMARRRVRRGRGEPEHPPGDSRCGRVLEALDEARKAVLEGDEDGAFDAAARAAFTLREKR
jgi:hypothetical protein